MRKIVMLCLLGVLGCGDDGHQGSGGSGGSGGTGGSGGSGGSGGNDMCAQAGTVCGTAIDTYLTDTGETQRPRDLSTLSIEAITFDAAGAATHYPGQGHADGSYTIPNVPDGTYTLKWADPDLLGFGPITRYIVTTKHKLDLGQVYYGRANATVSMVSPTNLVFNVSGLQTWEDGDRLQLTAFGAGGFAYDTTSYDDQGMPLPGNPTAGATSLSALTVDWSTSSVTSYVDQPMLIDGAQGDRLVMTQLFNRNNPGASYLTVGKIFHAPAFTMGDGQPSMLSGAFEDVPQDRQAQVSWKRSEFAPYLTAIHPDAQSFGDPSLSIDTWPRDDAYTYVYPNLLQLTSTSQVTGDVDLNLQYGNPFPQSWPAWVTSCMYASASLPYPTGSLHMSMTGYVCGYMPLATSQSGTVRPTVSPPRDLKVNGMAATSAIAGVGMTPLVSWTAPALGTPKFCSVAVRIHPDGGGLSKTVYISVPPTTTSVRIPPGILDGTGFAYAFRVSCGDDLGYAAAFTSVVLP